MSLISRLHHIFQGTREGGYDGTIMEFEDPEVKKYLVENIGGENGITNPDFGIEGVKGIAGEVTYEQVLACKKVDFRYNKKIRRFNELEYFKNLSTVKFWSSSIEEVSLPYMTIGGGAIFSGCTKLRKLTTKYGLKIISAESMFYDCTSLTTLDTRGWDLSYINLDYMFCNSTSLVSIDLSDFPMYFNWSAFFNCSNLETLVGKHTETDNVILFRGNSSAVDFRSNPKINLATVNAVIRGVERSYRTLPLFLPEPVKSQVTEEYKKILESKNWEIM